MNKTLNAVQEVVRANEDGCQTISYSNLRNLEFRVWGVKMPQVLFKVFDINKEHAGP